MPDIKTPSVRTPEDEVNEMFEELKYLDETINLEAKIANNVGISPEELIIHRDLSSEDPRKVTKYPDVAVNIRSIHREGASRDISYYHDWVDSLYEDRKERWSVRIYTDRTDKAEEIMRALSTEIPLIRRFAK